MKRLIKAIEEQLRKGIPEERVSGRDKLLGKTFRSLGIPLKQVRETISKVYEENPEIDGKVCIGIAEELLTREFYEEKISAILLLGRLIKDRQIVSFSFLEKLMMSYIDEWSLCDTFATEVLAPRLQADWDIGQGVLIKWSKSQNEWLRRCALVGLVKCKGKIPNWQEFSQAFLGNFKQEDKRIVKRAVVWLEKQLKDGEHY